MIVTCILRNASDTRTLCGERRGDTPYVLARFVMDHKRGHGLVTCAECRGIAETEGVALDHD